MKKILAICLFFVGSLFALYEDGDPSVVANVNVITGQFSHIVTDHVVEGPVPYPIVHSFLSSTLGKADEGRFYPEKTRCFDPRWQLFSHLFLLVEGNRFNHRNVHFRDNTGELVTFSLSYEQKGVFVPKGSFLSYGEHSGRNNSANHALDLKFKKGKATVSLANGGKRFYRKSSDNLYKKKKTLKSLLPQFEFHYYLLEEEILPSGHIINYDYLAINNEVLISILGPSRKRTLSQIRINFSEQEIQIHTTGKGWIKYTGPVHDGEVFLENVISSSKPTESYKYAAGNRRHRLYLTEILHNDKTTLTVDYYSIKDNLLIWNKVRSILNAKNEVVARFEYDPKYTNVYDANGRLTRYRCGGTKIHSIEHFDENKTRISYEVFLWDEDLLTKKVLRDANHNILFEKTYEYDTFRNVTKETFKSSDLESVKHFTYNRANLLIEEQDESGRVNTYQYLGDTNLITQKQTLLDGEILTQETYIYDEDNLLIEEIHPHTHIIYNRSPKTGLIVEKVTPFEKTLYKYNIKKQIISESVYDKDENHCYTTYTEYNDKGWITKQTTPNGNENTYKYDINGNIIEKKEVGQERKTITYDLL